MASRMAQMAKERRAAAGARAPPAPALTVRERSTAAPATRSSTNRTSVESSRQTGANAPVARAQKRPRSDAGASGSGIRDSRLEVIRVESFDVAEEGRLKELLNKMEALSLEDFTALKIDERPPISNDAARLSLHPRVYEDSSVLCDPTGSTAMELYNNFLLPRDRMMLLERAHPVVEKMGASHLNQVGLCMHQLSLSNSQFKKENDELNKKLEIASRTEVKYEAKMVEMAREIKKMKAEDLEHRKQLVIAQRCLAAEKKEAYETGLSDGQKKEMALNSVTRSRAVRDFLNSTRFNRLMMSKAMDDHLDGYCKALDYLKKDSLISPEFNVDQYVELHAYEDLLRPSATPDEVLPYKDFPEFDEVVATVLKERQDAILASGSMPFMHALESTVDRGEGLNEDAVNPERIAERDYPAPLTINDIMEDQIQTPPPIPVEVPASEPGPSGVEPIVDNDPAPE